MTQQPILPGSWIGIIGGGQLGRMLAMQAKRMGYFVHIYTSRSEKPQEGILSSAGQVSDRETVAPYEDKEALTAFANSVSVVTIEFENIPTVALETTQPLCPTRPAVQPLYISQNRLREKTFFSQQGLPTTPYMAIPSQEDFLLGIEQIGLPCILKTASLGYDGKGQHRINTVDDIPEVDFFEQTYLLEKLVPDLKTEVSIMVARSPRGEIQTFPIIENIHKGQILDYSVCPARNIEPALVKQIEHAARQVAEALRLEGLLCIEFFITESGQLMVNEMAPRPHNSGHLTIEACATSQYEQTIRAICNLPLGPTSLRAPAAMVNLMSNLWREEEDDTPGYVNELNWSQLLAMYPDAQCHLYGKTAFPANRKMGHMTFLHNTPDAALERAIKARTTLVS